MSLINNVAASIALHRAERFKRSGKLKDAIDYLTKANRRSENGKLERTLVDYLLQIDVPEQSPGSANREQASATIAPLHCKSGDIPEIKATQLSAAILREAISRSGYLIVRGLFNDSETKTVRACIDESLSARVNSMDSNDAPESDWYYPSPYFPGDHVAWSKRDSNKKFERTGSIKVIDSPSGAFKVLELYRKYALKALFEEYFNAVPLLATTKWVFRLITPIPGMDNSIGGGWHQDGQFMGDGVNALNMWVALSECGDGTSAPGITLLPRRIQEILEYGTRGARLDWVVGGELVQELAQDCGTVSPHFAPGDALFFDHYGLHRSGHGPNQNENRYALESWFYAQSAHSRNYVIPYF